MVPTPGSARTSIDAPTPSVRATPLPAHRYRFVRLSHWIVTVCVLALVISGGEIIISHPRFYWGETGNVLEKPLFVIPIAASRPLVDTGRGYVLPDQNGWSRGLHFEAAWLLVITGLTYALCAIFTGHLRRNLLPSRTETSWHSVLAVLAHHLRLETTDPKDQSSYNVLQKTTYLLVAFGLFPFLIWTGLALSPAFDSAFPATVRLLGGRQCARTLHFFSTIALLLFFLAHIGLVWREGFKQRVGAMITGKSGTRSEEK